MGLDVTEQGGSEQGCVVFVTFSHLGKSAQTDQSEKATSTSALVSRRLRPHIVFFPRLVTLGMVEGA